MYDILQLNEMLVPELREIAENLEIKSYKKLTKQNLIIQNNESLDFCNIMSICNLIGEPGIPGGLNVQNNGIDCTDEVTIHGDCLSSTSDIDSPKIIIYPNPAKETLVIQADSRDRYTYQIQTIEGKTLLEVNQIGLFHLNVSTYNPGIYFFKALDEKGNTLIEKFVIE